MAEQRKDRKKIPKFICKASKVAGDQLETVNEK